MSKQAALERRQQQQDDDLTFRPNTSGHRGRSQSAGRHRPTGEQRIEQLARPKTAHWDKCECVRPPFCACLCVRLPDWPNSNALGHVHVSSDICLCLPMYQSSLSSDKALGICECCILSAQLHACCVTGLDLSSDYALGRLYVCVSSVPHAKLGEDEQPAYPIARVP